MHGTEEKMKNFNMMKKLLALTLGAAMLLAVMTGCGKKDTAQEPADDQQQQQEEQQPAEPATLLEQIKAKGKVVVGTEAQYAPYEFKDLDANFAGCDMWLAQQIADSLGVELEVVDMAFDGIIPAVQSGQVDLGIAAFTNTPERAEEIDFSDLYETSAQLLIVKAGNADTYSTGIYQTFESKAAELGLNIVSVTTFTNDTTDFSVQVTEAKNAGADVVFLPIYYTPASQILNAANTMGYKPVFFALTAWTAS